METSTIVKCFTNAGVLDKERNVVKALAPPSDEDPFSDLEDDVLQVNALLEESCGDTATSADESIADENLLPVCQEVDENWEEKFPSSLSQNSDNEDGASDDEEIVEMDDVLPEPLKIKSYKEALSELNHMTNFFTAQGASQLADELSKVVSKPQSLYLKQRLALECCPRRKSLTFSIIKLLCTGGRFLCYTSYCSLLNCTIIHLSITGCIEF